MVGSFSCQGDRCGSSQCQQRVCWLQSKRGQTPWKDLLGSLPGWQRHRQEEPLLPADADSCPRGRRVGPFCKVLCVPYPLRVSHRTVRACDAGPALSLTLRVWNRAGTMSVPPTLAQGTFPVLRQHQMCAAGKRLHTPPEVTAYVPVVLSTLRAPWDQHTCPQLWYVPSSWLRARHIILEAFDLLLRKQTGIFFLGLRLCPHIPEATSL